MNILITGGAGFIGSHLAEYLLAAGHHVKTLDNLSTGRAANLEHLKKYPKHTFVQGSVTDRSCVEPLMKWCDHCYHLGAPVGVKYIMQNPILTIVENIRAIDLILELTDRFKKRTLVASTSEVYGKSLDLLDTSGKGKLKEGDYRLEGSTTNHRWAYANTKALDEFLSFAYHKERGTEICIIRFFNTVGPRQVADYGMVIPNFIQRALVGEPILVHGTGEQIRSFMHVKDVVQAVTELMLTGKGIGDVFNVGNPQEITINELAKRVLKLTGSSSEIRHVPYGEAFSSGFEDMYRRTPDISKLERTLDFKIKYQLDDILTEVIAEFRKTSTKSS